MKDSFKHLLRRPLVILYLVATSIGNTSFLYSVFAIFMLSGFAVITGFIVGALIAVGMLALFHAISKGFVTTRISIFYSWAGIVIIMALGISGWFLIFHHVTFGLADANEKRQLIIQREFQKVENENKLLVNDVSETLKEGYTQAVKQRSPKTAKEANKAIVDLTRQSVKTNTDIANKKINLLIQGESLSNVLLSYISRFRESLGDTTAEILILMLALILSSGIDVCGFAFNRVHKNIDNQEGSIQEGETFESEYDDFEGETNNVTEDEYFQGEYNNIYSEENVTPDVTPDVTIQEGENVTPDVTLNGKPSRQKKTEKLNDIDKKIQKLINQGITNKTEIAEKAKTNRQRIYRYLKKKEKD